MWTFFLFDSSVVRHPRSSRLRHFANLLRWYFLTSCLDRWALSAAVVAMSMETKNLNMLLENYLQMVRFLFNGYLSNCVLCVMFLYCWNIVNYVRGKYKRIVIDTRKVSSRFCVKILLKKDFCLSKQRCGLKHRNCKTTAESITVICNTNIKYSKLVNVWFMFIILQFRVLKLTYYEARS